MLSKAPEKAAAAPLSQQRADELSEQCGKMSHEQFRRAWTSGTENTAEGQMTAEFAHHYNAKLNTCFYLLTVNRYAHKNGRGDAPASTLNKMLFDINGGELYGEYLGLATAESPAGSFPKTCRVEGLYCASAREWEVLVRAYFED
jgi:hypothetical protein